MSVMRPGKTKRDHENGSWHRRLRNQQLRRVWNQDYMHVAKTGGKITIPYPVIGK